MNTKSLKRYIALFAVLIMVIINPVYAGANADEPESDLSSLSKCATGAEALAKMTAESFKAADGVTMNYRIYYSPGYDKRNDTKPAKVILYLHGLGECGDDNARQVTGLVTSLHYLLSDYSEVSYKDYQYIVVAPQCPAGEKWVNTDFSKGSYSLDNVEFSPALKRANELIDEIGAKEIVDFTQIMILGVSMGGYGAWDLAMRFPSRFSAIVPMCGAGDPTKAKDLAAMRIWAFHCADDQAVPVKGSRDMDAALKAADAKAKYTEYPTGGHAVWHKAASEETEPSLLDWLIIESSKAKVYSITSMAGNGGSITGSQKTIPWGGSAAFNITPNSNYVIDTLIINGEEHDPSVLSANTAATVFTYTFYNVIRDGSISVTFRSLLDRTEKRAFSEVIDTVVIALTALALVGAVGGVGLYFGVKASKSAGGDSSKSGESKSNKQRGKKK